MMRIWIVALLACLLSTAATAQTGTAKSAAALNSEIASTLASGQTPPITAAMLRQVVLDMVATTYAPQGSVGVTGSITGSTTATGSTAARTLAARAADVINVKDYGAVCDGSTDDAAALQAAFTAGAGKLIIIPAGTCNYSVKLTLVGSGTSLRGAGRGATILRSTFGTGDELYIGDSSVCPVNGDCPTTPTYEYHLSDFTLFSTVTRSSGYTIDIHNSFQVYIHNVESNNDLLNALSGGNVHFNGIFTDHSGGTHIEGGEFRAQNDVWTITQSTDSSMHSLLLRFGTVGLRLAGGASGFHCTQSGISESVNNLVVDNTIATTQANHAATFGSACYIDTSSGDNIVINTAVGGLNVFQFSGMTIETENGAGVHVIAAPNASYLVFDNVVIGSYSGVGTGHGILQDDCSVNIALTGGSKIWFNSGFGIDQTCTPSGANPIYIAYDTAFISNTLGNANFNLSSMPGQAATAIATSQPALDLSQTWNAGGVTFTGTKLNVTKTASAAASLLMDLQVGGVSQFNVTEAGSVAMTGQLVVGAGAVIGWNGRGYQFARSDGVFLLTNNAQNSFSRLEFGGETSSFPAIKRNGNAITLRQADDTIPTVASLTACATGLDGSLATVSDATAITTGSVVAGTGAHHVLVYCNGTSWLVVTGT